jgi:hypothetical protein
LGELELLTSHIQGYAGRIANGHSRGCHNPNCV